MNIDRITLEKLMQTMGEERDVTLSIFVLSDTRAGLTRLALENLSKNDRKAKLKEYAKQNSLVAVIEKGDEAFAHVNSAQFEKLQGKSLSIEGKTVALKAISDEGYDQLTAIVAAFGESVLQPEEEKSEDSKEVPVESEQRRFFAGQGLVRDPIFIHYASMQNMPSKIISNFIRRMNEARREDQERKRADEERDSREKKEIKRQILNKEIVSDETKRQELNQQVLKRDAEHIDLTRGGESTPQ